MPASALEDGASGDLMVVSIEGVLNRPSSEYAARIEFLNETTAALVAESADADGERWTRAGLDMDDAQNWWSERLGWMEWDHIDAVRVLSEGVAS